MFEPDVPEPLPAKPVHPTSGGFEDDEPPSRPGRHAAWRDVPDHLWDDWRWQTQNSVRSVRQLRNLLPFAPDELEALGYRDLRAGSALALVEWPERGAGALGTADLSAEIAYANQGRRLTLAASD